MSLFAQRPGLLLACHNLWASYVQSPFPMVHPTECPASVDPPYCPVGPRSLGIQNTYKHMITLFLIQESGIFCQHPGSSG